MCAYVNVYQCGIQRALQSIAISVLYDPALGSCQAITPRSPTPSLLKPCDAQRALLLAAVYRDVHAHAAGQFEWVYCCAKQHSEPSSHPHNKRGTQVDEITLTPLQLIDRIAKLVPPARTPGSLPGFFTRWPLC